MDWLKAGAFAMIPFIAASIGVLVGGQLSDRLLKSGATLSLARKLPVITGLIMSTTIVTAIWLENDVAVIAVMSLAFFGQGTQNLGWTLLSDRAGKTRRPNRWRFQSFH
jgi:ACS family D-galactonate transporter-like MFS transporter